MSNIDISFDGPRPFSVDIPQSAFEKVIEAARTYESQRYLNNLLSKEIDEEDFTYGLPPTVFLRLLNRLKDGFSWSEWQNKMNAMGSHHILTVKGIDAGADLDVHFVHKRSENPNAIPLLMLHGWPSSFLEFHGIIPLLTAKYHVVCPSIPGYTFSSPPKNLEGSNDPAPLITGQIVRSYDAVMRSLGYQHYVVQGGDWGSLLAMRLAQVFPDRCRAVYLNAVLPNQYMKVDEASLSDFEKRGWQRWKEFQGRGQAYLQMQGTTPYTLGATLSTSPIAALAYIGEKMYRWSEPGVHLPPDYIIANCLLYWFTGSLTSSFWLYYLVVSGNGMELRSFGQKISQPTAVGFGPHEVAWAPEKTIKEMGINMTSYVPLARGGHFIVAEAPDLLAKDMDRHFSSEEVKKALAN